MRINVYTEELLTDEDGLPIVEIVKANYISSRTKEPMTNHGLRIYLKSAPALHYIPRDDDRSAITFWCGAKEKNIQAFLDLIDGKFKQDTLRTWREKVNADVKAAEIAEGVSSPSSSAIELTPYEIQSGLNRVRWAEGLIRQLPENHDGRNSWLINYGTAGKTST